MKEDLVWFIKESYTSLHIKKYKSISDDSILSSIVITDKEIVNDIVEKIKQMPTSGTMYKSFSKNAARTDAIFTAEDGATETIPLYGKSFQAPDTAIISNAALYDQIISYLPPDVATKE